MLRDTCNLYFYLCNTSNWNSRLTFPLGHMTHKGEMTPVFCNSISFFVAQNQMKVKVAFTICQSVVNCCGSPKITLILVKLQF